MIRIQRGASAPRFRCEGARASDLPTLSVPYLVKGVMNHAIMTPMTKTQVYFPESDLSALHKVSRRTKRPVAALIREAVQRVWLQAETEGPIGLWRGTIKRTSVDHDSIYDVP